MTENTIVFSRVAFNNPVARPNRKKDRSLFPVIACASRRAVRENKNTSKEGLIYSPLVMCYEECSTERETR